MATTTVGRRVGIGDHVLYINDQLQSVTAHVEAFNQTTKVASLTLEQADGSPPTDYVANVPYDVNHGRNTWDYNANFTLGTVALSDATPYVITNEFAVLMNATTADKHVQLPTAALNAGRLVSIHFNIGGNNVIVDAATGDNIDGVASYTLTDVGRSVLLIADGIHGWHIMALNF